MTTKFYSSSLSDQRAKDGAYQERPQPPVSLIERGAHVIRQSFLPLALVATMGGTAVGLCGAYTKRFSELADEQAVLSVRIEQLEQGREIQSRHLATLNKQLFFAALKIDELKARLETARPRRRG